MVFGVGCKGKQGGCNQNEQSVSYIRWITPRNLGNFIIYGYVYGIECDYVSTSVSSSEKSRYIH